MMNLERTINLLERDTDERRDAVRLISAGLGGCAAIGVGMLLIASGESELGAITLVGGAITAPLISQKAAEVTMNQIFGKTPTAGE